jgi:excinuclease ABC subunit A
MLVELLKQKQKAGHTILTIDHRDETVQHADVEIQMGPGAGEFGGEITQYRENSAL